MKGIAGFSTEVTAGFSAPVDMEDLVSAPIRGTFINAAVPAAAPNAMMQVAGASQKRVRTFNQGNR
jgi:hypothetical protein